MAATGLLALLDDITTVLDDVAAMSKVAAKKTAGIAGDDLAVNAEGLVGLDPSRELPIVGKVALGSLVNKAVLIPIALVLPTPVITPLLMIGGTFLCYEGVHKVVHKRGPEDESSCRSGLGFCRSSGRPIFNGRDQLRHSPASPPSLRGPSVASRRWTSEEHHQKLLEAVKSGPGAVAEVERQKVKQAIITDFVLSAEIVAVALGTVATEPLLTKAGVLSIVGVGMTIVVYGLVASIVKVDDVGLHLQRTGSPGSPRERAGKALVAGMPHVMKAISFIGTVAMFLVGGGIVLHGLKAVEQQIHQVITSLTHLGFVVSALEAVAALVVGIIVGVVAVMVVEGVKRMLGALGSRASSQG